MEIPEGYTAVFHTGEDYPYDNYNIYPMVAGVATEVVFRGRLFTTKDALVAGALAYQSAHPRSPAVGKYEVVPDEELDPLFKLKQQLRAEIVAKHAAGLLNGSTFNPADTKQTGIVSSADIGNAGATATSPIAADVLAASIAASVPKAEGTVELDGTNALKAKLQATKK